MKHHARVKCAWFGYSLMALLAFGCGDDDNGSGLEEPPIDSGVDEDDDLVAGDLEAVGGGLRGER